MSFARPPRVPVNCSASVCRAALTADGHTGVFVCDNGKLEVWDLDALSFMVELCGHTAAVLMVAITPDGKTAISGSSDRKAIVWDLEADQLKHVLGEHTGLCVGRVHLRMCGQQRRDGLARPRSLRVGMHRPASVFTCLIGNVEKIHTVRFSGTHS